MSHLQILESELRKFRIDLSLKQKAKLAAYCDELIRWNARLNLTALTGVELVRRLMVEPAWIGRELTLGGVLVDIGSGNGSPAVPLQIVCRLDACHLVEARAKRAAFLRHLGAILELPHNEVHRGRFREVASRFVAPVDWISLQGVALTEELVGTMRRIATPATRILWITSAGVASPLRPFSMLRVPFTHTEVSLFRLDQS